jgi:hypothetical protein
MKNTISVFFLMLFIQIATAQNFHEISTFKTGDKTIQSPEKLRNTEKPDSILYLVFSGSWDSATMEIYTYDNQNRIISVLTKLYLAGTFSETNRSLYQYTPDGQLLMIMNEKKEQGNWKKDTRYINNYDQHGNRTSSKDQFYESQNWVTAYGDSAQFQYNGPLITEMINMSFNNMTMQWQYTGKTIVTYQGAVPVQTLTLQWSGSDWFEVFRFIDVAWDLGFENILISTPTHYIAQSKNGEQWVNAERHTSFVSHNRVDIQLRQYWDEPDSSWMDFNRTLYIYNADSLLEEKREQDYWDTTWLNHSRLYYEYDNHKNMTLQTQDIWNGAQWLIQDGNRYTYTYDTENRMETAVSEYYYSISGIWVYDIKQIYFYDGQMSAGKMPASDLAVYPNPAKDKIRISFDHLQIADDCSITVTDMSGKICYYEEFSVSSSTKELDIHDWVSAMYLIHVQSEKQSFWAKFFVE